MYSPGSLVYPDVSMVNMGEMIALPLGQDNNPLSLKWSQMLETGETVLGSGVWRLNTTA